MKEKDEETIRNVNDETPENFTRYGNGHKLKAEEKYTDGEPPHEDEEDDAGPDQEFNEIPKKKYP